MTGLLSVALATLLFSVGLALVPTASADATDINTNPDGYREQSAANNDVGAWCDAGQGAKKETSETPYEMPAADEGTHWTLLVIKAGSGERANAYWINPVAGDLYQHPDGHDTSHVILCWDKEDVPPTTTTTTTTTTTLPPADGSLTIVKETNGHNGTFGFTSTKLENFSLTTSDASASTTFDGLDAGVYDVSEDLTSLGREWSFEALSCDAIDYSITAAAVDVNLHPGENATCTFTNAYTEPPAPKIPAISIEKSTNGVDADDPSDGPTITEGEAVTWSYVVANTGETPLADLVVTDDTEGQICSINELAVGESSTCDLTGTATLGEYANMGSVEARHGEATVADHDPSHYVGIAAPEPLIPAIDIDKTPDVQEIYEGEDAIFTITVTNTGDVELIGGGVTDAQTPACSRDLGSMAVGASASYTCEAANVTEGFTNVAVVTAEDASGTPVSDTDDAVVTVRDYASLTVVVKMLNGTDQEFQFTGDSGLSDFNVKTTNRTGQVDFPKLEAGEYALTQNLASLVPANLKLVDSYCDVDGGRITGANGEKASAVLTDGDHVTCTFVVNTLLSSIDIEKLTNGEDADASTGPVVEVGSTVTWTYLVTNTGETTVTDVKVTDDKEGDVCTIDRLPAGAAEECKLTGTALIGQYRNVATATAGDVTDSDPSHYFGQETAATAQIGDTVFHDVNGNGAQDAGEPGINGAEVNLSDADGNVVATLTTDTGAWDGFYKFLLNDLVPGTYTVELEPSSVASTYELTTASSFTLDIVDGDDIVTADFGLHEAESPTDGSDQEESNTDNREELPYTGTDAGTLALFGLALLAAGAAAILLTRRKREDF